MKLHNLLVAGVLGLLAPAALMAADTSSNTAVAAKSDPKPKATQCDKTTGSIIRPLNRNDCKPSGAQPMRTYTQEDIQRTGEMDVANALRKLDPSIH